MAYYFLAPYLIVFLLFRFRPVVVSFFVSFTHWNIVGTPRSFAASLLDRPLYGRLLVRTTIFALYIMMSLVVDVVWLWFYDTHFGFINYYL